MSLEILGGVRVGAPVRPEAVPGPRREAPAPWYFRRRSHLIIAAALFLALWPLGRLPLEGWSIGIGLFLIAAAAALRLGCIRQIGGAARKTSEPKAKVLVTWGPFAWVRNPIYIANLTLLSGFAVLAGLPWAIPPFIALLLMQYSRTIQFEEAFLEREFGEAYREYCRSTPRWIPRPRRRTAPAGFQRYPLRKMLKRERSLMLQIVGGLALVALRFLPPLRDLAS